MPNRGKRLVVLVGQRKALAIAVRNQGSRSGVARRSAWPGATLICGAYKIRRNESRVPDNWPEFRLVVG